MKNIKVRATLTRQVDFVIPVVAGLDQVETAQHEEACIAEDVDAFFCDKKYTESVEVKLI